MQKYPDNLIHGLITAALLLGSSSVRCVFDRSGLSGGMPDDTGVLCGNAVLDQGEDCDTDELGGQTCQSLGLGIGDLGCTSSCTFNTSGCTTEYCGNNQLDPGEDCDGDDLGGRTCADLGFRDGPLSCVPDECTFDTSECVPVTCGDGILNGDEDCDQSDLGGQTCQSLGLEPGVLLCRSNCRFDLTGCPGCGNGVLENGEYCDTTDFGAFSCLGGLACTSDCLLDGSSCILASAGTGADGDLTVSGSLMLDTTSATPYQVTSLGPDWAEVSGGPPTFQVGDEVILINMQGAVYCNPGIFEFFQVASVDATGIGFSIPVSGAYGVGGDNGDLSGQKIVVQRVPHFANVHLLSDAVLSFRRWNGTMGGLLVMRVSGELTVDSGGEISMSARGYRGGGALSDRHQSHGRQGESICGNPQSYSTSPNDGGGGGGKYDNGDDDCGQGGGGGGFGQQGTSMPYTDTCKDRGNENPASNGGMVYGSSSIYLPMLGSGGGSGATDTDSDSSGAGGRGGGIIWIFANRLVLNGGIFSNGGNGSEAGDTNDAGNGGGGSGGSILLSVGFVEGTGNVSATGGSGYPSQTEWNSAGGNGGSGRIWIDYHTADGSPYDSVGAETYFSSLFTPAPGWIGLALH